MADVSHWERAFVNAYIVATKRDRYLGFLKGRKHRRKIIERLNHSLDYDERHATPLGNPYKFPDALIEFLLGRGVDHTSCYFMADGNAADGTSMRLDRAVPKLLDNHWGALIICPPKPIVVYKPEDIGDLILLGQFATEQTDEREPEQVGPLASLGNVNSRPRFPKRRPLSHQTTVIRNSPSRD